MAILVIRHGETELNASRVLQHPDTPLSARGRQQAARLAERLGSAPLAAILVSDYRRALDTAAPLRAASGVPMEVIEDLRERNYGDLRGRPYHTLEQDPHALDYEPPGGESWAVFHARVARVWQTVLRSAERSTGDLAVVTHGLVCRSLCERVLGYPAPLVASDVVFLNTCVTVVEGPPWRLELVGCVRHLDEDLQGRGALA